ncbi:hypothetical protein CCPUN_07760 [Cardinium endosymbiont of Culicoides punctatus]|nr:hypothetical protein CCPUN_07760 [Cardinium endosymbiont of Culicoides punctatus]
MAMPLANIHKKEPSIFVFGSTHIFHAIIVNAPVTMPITAVINVPRKPKTARIKGAVITGTEKANISFISSSTGLSHF